MKTTIIRREDKKIEYVNYEIRLFGWIYQLRIQREQKFSVPEVDTKARDEMINAIDLDGIKARAAQLRNRRAQLESIG